MRDEPMSSPNAPGDGRDHDDANTCDGAGSTPSVTRDVDLDASVDAVWDALTEPATLAEWMGGPATLDARPGGDGRLTDVETDTVRRVLVTESTPGRRLSFTWWPEDDRGAASEVRFDLSPTGDGTRLRVTERPLVMPITAGARASLSASPVASPSSSAWCSAATGAWTWRLAALELRCANLILCAVRA
jgi:uncharacterized protein YndB with AHSA1/START domain